MDYKKKYEEALDNFKKIKAANKDNKELVDFIEYNYPELKEGEDEKIRKELIRYLKGRARSGFNQEVRICNDAIAWLEKQGEQKTDNKVEPKFKVGDWIITNKNHIWYVDETPETTLYLYRLINQYGKVEVAEFEIVDKKTRLWTIQDAKDGDVLATNNGDICIFDGTAEDGIYPFAYCGITKYGFESYDRKLPFAHDNIHPATKEQRDLLFQKMKEAGYEWDAEKKELKKIEQRQKQYDIDILEKHITKDYISELAHTVIVRNGWEIVDAKEQELVD